jgi:hypothetical protein
MLNFIKGKQMTKKIVWSSIVAAGILSIAGCGGGSDSTESPVVATLTGVAVDDLILNGVVTAKTPSGTELVKGRTSGTDGSYELTLAHSGVVIVNVSCDANSTMYNPETNTSTTCANDVELNSIAKVQAGSTQKVNITPLTEVLHQRVLEQAGDPANINTEHVEKAREEIGLMLGVDPIADDPTQNTYASVINAIHAIAEERNDTVIHVTEQLADALSDGQAEGEPVVVELVQTLEDENITNPLTENNGTYTPPENPAPLSNVDAAKALFAELRTQAMSVVDYNNSGTPGFLDTEAQAMDQALNNVTMNIEYMGDVVNVLADAIGQANEQNLTHMSGTPMGAERVFTLDKTGTGAWSYSIVEGSSTWSGTVSFPDILLGDEAEAQLYTQGTLTMAVNGTVPLDYTAVTEAGVTDSQSFEGTVKVTKKATGADISLAGKVASNGTSIELKEATAELAYTKGQVDADGYTDPVFDYFKLKKVVLQGIVGGYTIDGSVTVNSYARNAGLSPKGGMYEDSESGFGVYFYCTDGSVVDVSNVTFSYDGATYQPSGYSYNDFWFDNIKGYVPDTDILPNLTYNGSCSSGTNPTVEVSWTWSGSEEVIANSGWLPNDITFAGAISRTGASMEGTLNAKWLNADTMDLDSEDATPLVNITFNGKLQMPERPEMLATLTFENTATHNTIGASYTYGSTVINMSALFDTDMENGDIEVTTHTGLRADLKITNGALVTDGTGTVTKDGALVGTLEERANVPVIKYIDGSFESLP